MQQKYKILVVEDEPRLRKALKDKFEREGFTIVTAENGIIGIDAYDKNMPDLILLDIIMPKMDGMTMLEKLQEEYPNFKTPVIILTNLSEPTSDKKSIVEKSFSDYLVKASWTLDDIVKKVKSKLN